MAADSSVRRADGGRNYFIISISVVVVIPTTDALSIALASVNFLLFSFRTTQVTQRGGIWWTSGLPATIGACASRAGWLGTKMGRVATGGAIRATPIGPAAKINVSQHLDNSILIIDIARVGKLAPAQTKHLIGRLFEIEDPCEVKIAE